MATPQTPVAPVAQPDPQLTQAGNMAVDPESLNPSQQAPQIAQETTMDTWRRWATGPFNTLLSSPAQAEAAMGWVVALRGGWPMMWSCSSPAGQDLGTWTWGVSCPAFFSVFLWGPRGVSSSSKIPLSR